MRSTRLLLLALLSLLSQQRVLALPTDADAATSISTHDDDDDDSTNRITPLNGTVVDTTTGKFTPITRRSVPNVAQFLDIPYARPPLGPLRFAPPVAAPYDAEVRTARRAAKACLQRYNSASYRGNALYDISVSQFGRQTSEDCLRLSVHVPRGAVGSSSELLPTMVFIYGGNFELGGYRTHAYNPAGWVERSQEHIVVKLNYRVNIMGFPNAAGLQEQGRNLNVGLLDQRLALEWVRDNIQKFGGDPSKITLWGQSAGAQSAQYLSYAYPSDPIARALILESTSATAPRLPTASGNFSYYADRLGCRSESPARELECMRALPSDKLRNFVEMKELVNTTIAFGPIADNVTVFNSTQRIMNGDFAKIPILAGSNSRDGFGIIPLVRAPQLPRNLTELGTTITLAGFQCPLLLNTVLKQQAGVSTFQYVYAGNFTNISPEPWLGAYHTSELPIVFGTLAWEKKLEPASTPYQRALSKHIQTLWLAFVKDPENGLLAYNWTDSGTSNSVALLGAPEEMQSNVRAGALRLQCSRAGLMS